MSENITTFGFGTGDDDIKGGMYEKFKAKKNEIVRLGVIFSDPKAMFAGQKVHFKERFFLCKKGICCEHLGLPKMRIGAVVCKYGTDRMGAVKMPFSYELLPWVFSETSYIKLKTVNSEFPLASHDIKISCTNEEYQHLDISPCQESIWQGKDELKNRILSEAKAIWDYIKKSIASDLSIEEIRGLLAVGPAVGSDPTVKLDLDKVLDSI